jgi:chromosome segregation ATPase
MSPILETRIFAGILFNVLPGAVEEDFRNTLRNSDLLNPAESKILQDSLIDQAIKSGSLQVVKRSNSEYEIDILSKVVERSLSSNILEQELKNSITLLEKELSFAKTNLQQLLLSKAEQQKKLDDLSSEYKNNASELELIIKKSLEIEGKVQEYLLQIKTLQMEIIELVSKREDDAKLIEQSKAANGELQQELVNLKTSLQEDKKLIELSNAALQEIVDTQIMKAKELEQALADLKKRVPTSITCVKGKTLKKVTAVNPKCPSGYIRKNS